MFYFALTFFKIIYFLDLFKLEILNNLHKERRKHSYKKGTYLIRGQYNGPGSFQCISIFWRVITKIFKKRRKGKSTFWHYLNQGRPSAISEIFLSWQWSLINLQKVNLGQEQESKSNLWQWSKKSRAIWDVSGNKIYSQYIFEFPEFQISLNFLRSINC